jgi:hypothetical protein
MTETKKHNASTALTIARSTSSTVYSEQSTSERSKHLEEPGWVDTAHSPGPERPGVPEGSGSPPGLYAPDKMG